MKTIVLAAALSLGLASAAAAQNAPVSFDQAAYVTCREAHAMNAEARRSLAIYLAEHSARYRGVALPDGGHGAHLGHLVRAGCTIAPEAYLFTVIDRVILSEKDKLPKR
jgi:hypothetical protein